MASPTNLKLFSSVQIGPTTLAHRVVMAPLTRSRSEQPGDIPGKLMLEYYSQRASHRANHARRISGTKGIEYAEAFQRVTPRVSRDPAALAAPIPSGAEDDSARAAPGVLEQQDRVTHEQEREEDRPAIQVALDKRSAAERPCAGADAEGPR